MNRDFEKTAKRPLGWKHPAAWLLSVLAATAGCAEQTHERYVPPSAAARQAVETALTTWKSGEPHATISSKPAVDVYDTRWRDGRELADFEIVEELTGMSHPAFKVRLQFANPPADEEATYLVIGIDPLMVFREEDYTRATGM